MVPRTGRFPGGAAFVSLRGGGSRSNCARGGAGVERRSELQPGEGDPVERRSRSSCVLVPRSSSWIILNPSWVASRSCRRRN